MAFTRAGAPAHASIQSVTASQHHVATVASDLNLADLAARAHGDLSDAPTSAHHVLYTDAEAVAAVEADAVLTIQGQIAFPAIANPAAGANVLDDYEEGSWTPGIADNNLNGTNEGQAYTTALGRYTKVGNLVLATFNVDISDLGTLNTAEQARVVGLPFVSANIAGLESGVAIGRGSSLGLANAGEVLALAQQANSSQMDCLVWTATTGTTTFTITLLSVGGQISGSVVYRI